MVFEIQNGSGYIVLVNGKDVERAVYQGTSDDLSWVKDVRLKFSEDGNLIDVDVYRQEDHNPLFVLDVRLNDYSRMYRWTLNDPPARIKLLSPRRYTLTINGDKAVVIMK